MSEEVKDEIDEYLVAELLLVKLRQADEVKPLTDEETADWLATAIDDVENAEPSADYIAIDSASDAQKILRLFQSLSASNYKLKAAEEALEIIIYASEEIDKDVLDYPAIIGALNYLGITKAIKAARTALAIIRGEK